MTTWERYQAIYREQQEEQRRQAEREAEAKVAAHLKAQREVSATVAALLGPLTAEWHIEPLPADVEECHGVGRTCLFHLTPLFDHPGPRRAVFHGWWYGHADGACDHDDPADPDASGSGAGDEGESCTDACSRTPDGVRRENALLRAGIPWVEDRVIHWGATHAEAARALAGMLCEWVGRHAEVPS